MKLYSLQLNYRLQDRPRRGGVILKARVALVAAISGFSMTPAAALEWSLDFAPDAPAKIVWQTDPDMAYNLWFSETLSDPFVHVDGFPKDGNGEALEQTFDPGKKGFFRIDTAPLGFALIPEGRFEMGDSYNEGGDTESPVHTVFVSAFYMATNEVTVALWNEVKTWGWANGYRDLPNGSGKGDDHAVHSISWWDAMKWCNARSEMEGRSPCYFLDTNKTDVYRVKFPKVQHEKVDWTADGYRLPTEAEWEKAARGGLRGKRFQWGDTISHDQANYYSDGVYEYDVSPTSGFHPDSDDSKAPFTLPVGSFPANDYGLYDMAGSVWEWCWDAYDRDYYAVSPEVDPRGPLKVWRSRVMRGGAWTRTTFEIRCSFRRRGWTQGDDDILGESTWGEWRDLNDHGLRVVRGR